jgi:hypothetical protein
MSLDNWGGCVMAEINAVLAGLTAEELKEIKALGPKGHLGRHLIDALDRASEVRTPGGACTSWTER